MKKEWINKGKRSNIYITIINGKKIAIKEQKKGIGAKDVALKEAKWLKKLNKYNIGPKFVKSGKNSVMYEFLEGEFIGDYIRKSEKKEIIKVLLDVLDKCRVMDKLKINKLEMTNPYKHVIIGKQIQLIDFERCRESDDPKNVTQFVQYIMSSKSGIKSQGINLDRKKIIPLLIDYKKDFSEKKYKNIRNVISKLS